MRAQSPKPKSFVDDPRRTGSTKPQPRPCVARPPTVGRLGRNTSGAPCAHTAARPANCPSGVGPSARAVFRLLPLHNHGGCAPWFEKTVVVSRRHGIGSMGLSGCLRGEPCLSPVNVPLHVACLHPQWPGGVSRLHRPTTSLKTGSSRRLFRVCSVLPPPGSRRQRALREPDGLFTRLALRLWSTPRRGISRALSSPSAPALNPTAPPSCTAEGFPLAHIRGSSGSEGGVRTTDGRG